jgi:hypothetical protein
MLRPAGSPVSRSRALSPRSISPGTTPNVSSHRHGRWSQQAGLETDQIWKVMHGRRPQGSLDADQI